MITEHTLRVLEYDRLLALISDRARSGPGREIVRALRPHRERASLEREREHVAEAVSLHARPGGFPDTAHDDIRDVLRALGAAGAVLEGTDLLRVARTLRVVRDVKTGLERASGASPRLRDIAEALVALRELEGRITGAIDPNGAILDGASPRLARLRRQGLSVRESVQERLRGLLGSLDLRAEREAYVTMRAGRYVIPVPAGDRGKVRGIVHDQSASGQTLFVEPFAAVDDNNALARCEAETREEERRVLADLSARVADVREAVAVDVELLARLDAYRAIAVLAGDFEMIVPELGDAAGELRFVAARHPLLLSMVEDRASIVPLDLSLEAGQRILILTGPNMGGKTVALKTLGLLATMTLAGLPVPAAPGTVIPFVRTVASDIGDEQSIAENLSTFASHLRHLASFLNEKEDPALVLLDELGTGTDPAEGGALARAYLEAMDGPGTRVVATTHLTALKEFAAQHPAALNGSMAFDERSLRPLFRLEVGAPGRSRAFDVAERLSFPPAVLSRARSLVTEEERRMDGLLAEVENARSRARRDEERARRERDAGTRSREEAERREREAERVLETSRARAAEEAETMLREAESLVKETRRKLGPGASPSAREVEETGRIVREKKRATEAASDRTEGPELGADYPRIERGEIRAGVRLFSLDLGSIVTADEEPSDRGMVHVTKGGIRFAVLVDRLRRPPSGQERGPKKSGGVRTDVGRVEAVSPELDLRGLNGADAESTVERYVDSALLSGVPLVRIIHGKGTGVLRQRVVGVLSRHFGVLAHRPGEPHEGGAGVTIAKLGER